MLFLVGLRGLQSLLKHPVTGRLIDFLDFIGFHIITEGLNIKYDRLFEKILTRTFNGTGRLIETIE